MTGQITAWREFAEQGRQPRQNPWSPQVEESEAGVPEHLDSWTSQGICMREKRAALRESSRSAKGPP